MSPECQDSSVNGEVKVEASTSDILMAATSGANKPGESMMTTFAVTKQRRATRAKFAKVRTGCVTCKRRHVKCDETKPGCKNCMKWAGFCGGYENLDAVQNSSSKASGAVASPKQQTSSDKPIRPRCVRSKTDTPEYRSSGHVSLSPSPRGRSFEPVSPLCGQSSEHLMVQPLYDAHQTDDTESLSSGYVSLSSSPLGQSVEPVSAAFQVASPQLRIFDDAFWKETMPRLIRESTAVRYANIAVHTLISAKSPTLIHSGDLHRHLHSQGEGGEAAATDHYGAALTCYGHALREARTASASHGDLREAILCSMFFVLFETINGDQVAAEAHLQSGQRILDELSLAWGRDQWGTHYGGGEPESLRKQLRYVLQFLAVQARDFGDLDGPGHGGLLDDFPGLRL